MEETIVKSLETTDLMRARQLDQISREVEERTMGIQHEVQQKMNEEKIQMLEAQANQRMIEILDLKEKENRQTNLKTKFELLEQERRVKEEMKEKKWRAEDELRKQKLEMAKQMRKRQMEVDEKTTLQANTETQMRILAA